MLHQPVGQVLLTNVAILKYKVGDKKFEIACYRNKVINWRNGVEKDLTEVLQSDEIHTSVVQGKKASKEELKKCFPDIAKEDIIKLILEKGDFQMGDKEREHELDLMFRDIANIIAEKCVHPDSKRPFSLDSIKNAMKFIHFAVRLNEAPKKQALECIKQLMEKFYIVRAEMKIQINVPLSSKDKLLEELAALEIKVAETNEKRGDLDVIAFIEPAKFRNIDDLLKKNLKAGSMEILIPAVMNREVSNLENAGTVNLQLREIKKSITNSNNDEDDDKKKGKKDKKTGKKNDSKGQKKDNFDDDKVNVAASKKKSDNVEKPSEKNSIEQPQEESKTISNGKDAEIAAKGEGRAFKCTTCSQAFFDSKDDFRNHYKSEWHQFNLKQKAEKKNPVTAEEFVQIAFDKEFARKDKK